jgi:gamma-glutamylcyclotransferase (GGCT)/AIG2-like uncharacterized protein YtfP
MKQLFLVYGTLKGNHGNHYIISHPTTKFLGKFTSPASYTLFDGGFPVVERGGTTPITGELYEVNDENTRNRVFSLEGCMPPDKALSVYDNEHSPDNWYDFDHIDTPHGKAVMFVMNEGESGRSNVIESGIWH